jgi:Mrp family chromosome partitioning ATPase
MENWVSSAERILLFCRDRQKRTIAFISPRSGAGVSTCVRATAAIAARSGYKTVVLDLSCSPAGDATVTRSVHAYTETPTVTKSNKQSFDVIAMRKSENDPYYFNNLARMQEIINKILNEYDYLFVDMPPILNREANAINPLLSLSVCDSVLLVSRPDEITQSSMMASLEQIRLAGAEIDGVILNQAQTATVGEQMARVVNRLLWLSPSLALSLTRRLRESDLLR